MHKNGSLPHSANLEYTGVSAKMFIKRSALIIIFSGGAFYFKINSKKLAGVIQMIYICSVIN